MEVFDSEGNKVEGVMTAAEVAAKIEAEKATWAAEQKPPAPAAPAADPNAVPEWFKPFAEQVTKLSGNLQTTVISDYAASLDADKKQAFNSRFDSLTGYPDTPEGMQKRAADAYLLTTGQPYEAQAINMGNIVAAGNGPVRPAAPVGEVDKAFAQTFGITEQDVAKYGNKQ